MERFFISGEPNCRGIMSTRCGRIGISWTLRQQGGRTFPRPPQNFRSEFLEKHYLNKE